MVQSVAVLVRNSEKRSSWTCSSFMTLIVRCYQSMIIDNDMAENENVRHGAPSRHKLIIVLLQLNSNADSGVHGNYIHLYARGSGIRFERLYVRSIYSCNLLTVYMNAGELITSNQLLQGRQLSIMKELRRTSRLMWCEGCENFTEDRSLPKQGRWNIYAHTYAHTSTRKTRKRKEIHKDRGQPI